MHQAHLTPVTLRTNLNLGGNDGSLRDRSDVCPLSHSIPRDPQEIIPGISEIEMLQVRKGISVPADKWLQNHLQGGFRPDDCRNSDQCQQRSDTPPGTT